MTEQEELLTRLTDPDSKSACAYAAATAALSRESNRFYPYVDDFAALLCHKNSLVRNRAISLLAANARWDFENRYAALLGKLLCHIADEKPITARQCIGSLPEIAAAKPELVPQIQSALEQADLSGRSESMQPLLEKDIAEALRQIARQTPALPSAFAGQPDER